MKKLADKKHCEKITNMTEEVESIYFFLFEKISKVFVEKKRAFYSKKFIFFIKYFYESCVYDIYDFGLFSGCGFCKW